MNGWRAFSAFLVAPLAVPVLMVFMVLMAVRPSAEDMHVAITSTVVVYLPFGYVGTLLVGLPVYRFLYTRNLTAFWIAPVAGAVGGAAGIIVLYALTMLILGLDFSFGLKLLFGEASIATVARLCQAGGINGAVVGTLLWLIARPDRVVAKSGEQGADNPAT